MGASISSGDDFVSEINVTPFVDVMLVLLIIFMVTAPMMTEGLDVDIPGVTNTETLPTEQEHVMIVVAPTGEIEMSGHIASLETFDEHLALVLNGEPKQVFIKADKNVPHGIVMEIMSKVRGAGINNVGMVAIAGEGASATLPTPAEKTGNAEIPTEVQRPYHTKKE